MTNRLHSIELTLGTDFNECSIAAAALNQSVQKHYSEAKKTQRDWMLVNSLGSVALSPVEAVPVTDEVILASGRSIELALYQHKQPKRKSEDISVAKIGLAAITRSDVAFEIASFMRRPGQIHCDYVQFGDQLNEPGLVVTSDDETERATAIQAMRDLLGEDHNAFGLNSYREKRLLEESIARFNERALRQKLESASYKPKVGVYIERHMKKEDARLHALYLYAANIGIVDKLSYYNFSSSARIPTSSDSSRGTVTLRLRIRRYTKKLESFFKNPEFTQILDGNLPGSHDLQGRYLLARLYAFHAHSEGEGSELQTVVTNLDNALGIEDTIAESLDTYEDEYDTLLRNLSVLKEASSDHHITIETKTGAVIAHSDVKLTISDEDDSGLAVNVYVRPTAMPDHQMSHVGSYVVNKLGKPSLNPQATTELLVLSKEALANID